jgi:hypothetical protein
VEEAEPIAILKYRISAQETRLTDHDEQLKQIRKNGHEQTNAFVKINEIVKRINETNDALNESVEEGYKVTCAALERIKNLGEVTCVALERIKDLEHWKSEGETEQKIKARYFRLVPVYIIGVMGILAAGHSIDISRLLELVAAFVKY